jgi:tetrahydromethanopterin S-methyltransferase subunit A
MKVEIMEATKSRKLVKDPSGFFTIFLDNEREEIVVEFYEPVSKEKVKKVATGKLGMVVCGTSAEALCHTIAREELVSRVDHAAYLGRELQKAEIALRYRLDYTQDEEIVFKQRK